MTEPYHIAQEKVRVHEVVGGGALGAVYRGVIEGREVALKCIHLLRDDAPAIRDMGGALRPDERRHVQATFKRECDLLRQLQHENILPFIGVVVDASRQPLYLACTYVASGNLHELIHGDSGCGLRTGDGGTLQLRIQLVAAVGVFSALEYLASVPAIHRDVKPANILTVLSRSGLDRVYLADFGEAQQLTRSMAAAAGTTAGHGAGTPDYMAPEMRSADAIKSPKADVFGAGVVLVEMSSGKQPDPGPQWRDEGKTVAVPEEERRRADMGAMRGRWEELGVIAQQCIMDRPSDRADAVCCSHTARCLSCVLCLPNSSLQLWLFL
jgi:serine/threonine protein kinase